MTAAARITQADMERATKAVKAAGYERARIRVDLSHSIIDIFLGESGEQAPPEEEWNDDDV